MKNIYVVYNINYLGHIELFKEDDCNVKLNINRTSFPFDGNYLYVGQKIKVGKTITLLDEDRINENTNV